MMPPADAVAGHEAERLQGKVRRMQWNTLAVDSCRPWMFAAAGNDPLGK
jgi:hypothetical protein